MKQPEKKIALGDVAQDSITGFKGVVVAVTEWLSGCRRVTIQPQALHDGKPIESETFDETQVVVLRSKETPEGSHRTGGPRPAPMRSRDPR